MTILVTGGAGFIGANFVLDWLSARRAGRQPRRAHLRRQPRNLAGSQGDARHVFVHGDIGDRALVDAPAAHPPAARRDPLRRREPRRPQHPRPGGVRADQRRRHLHAAGGGARLLGATAEPDAAAGVPLPPRVAPTRSTARWRPDEPAFTETHPYEPNSPYSASKAASDHLVRAWHHTYGLPVLTTNCSNNYGPLPLSREADPADDRQRAGRQAAAGLRRRAAGARLAVRERPLRAIRARARPRPARRDLQRRRLERASPTSRSCTPSARCSTSCGPTRPARYRALITYVTDRPGHDRRYAIDARKIERELGWRPAETFETGIRKTVQWYLDHADWVGRRAERRLPRLGRRQLRATGAAA